MGYFCRMLMLNNTNDEEAKIIHKEESLKYYEEGYNFSLHLKAFNINRLKIAYEYSIFLNEV